jgi:hypothetical protein
MRFIEIMDSQVSRVWTWEFPNFQFLRALKSATLLWITRELQNVFSGRCCSPNGPSYDESNVSPQLSYLPILIPTTRNMFLHLVCLIDVIKIGLIKITLSYFLFWSSRMTCHFDLTSYGVCSGLKHVICSTQYQEITFHAIW